MTVREFLNEFSERQDAFRWECFDGAVRGTRDSGSTRHTFDPIAAVLFASVGEVETDPFRAAARLGLSSTDAAAICDAVEGTLWKEIDGANVLDGYSEWLREEICDRAVLDLTGAGGVQPERVVATVPPVGIPLEPELQLQHF